MGKMLSDGSRTLAHSCDDGFMQNVWECTVESFDFDQRKLTLPAATSSAPTVHIMDTLDFTHSRTRFPKLADAESITST